MAAFVGVVALIAGGFLFLLFKSPASVPSEMRVTDYAAEMAAGTLQKTSAATAPEPSCENAAPVFPPDLGSRGPRHGGPGRHETPSSDQMEARGSLEPRRCTVSDSE